MSGRFRYRRRSGMRSGYRRSRFSYSRNRSSLVKRARGNAKAANAQADVTNVTINLMHKNMCMTNSIYPYPALDITPLNTIIKDRIDIGVCAINIFDLLAKSEFFNCYAPMYDQFRITAIKVKITPVKWASYNQEYAQDNNITFSTDANANPLLDTKAYNLRHVTLSNNYQYPQSLTLITAWDRTGLSATQFNKLKNFIVDWNTLSDNDKNALRNQIKATLINDKGDPNNQGFTYVNMPNIEDLWFTNIGDKISTYSSAQTKQLIAGQNCTINRYLYPQNQQEKSLFYSTNNLISDFHKSSYDCSYEQEDDFEGTSRLTNYNEDPSIPFKPTLLIGVLGANDLSVAKETVNNVPNAGFDSSQPAGENNQQNVNVENTPVFKNKVRPIVFNCEFDIGVTFRGLRKTQVVADEAAEPIDIKVTDQFINSIFDDSIEVPPLTENDKDKFTELYDSIFVNDGGPYKPITLDFSELEIEEVDYKLTRAELIDLARNHKNNGILNVDEDASVINSSTIDFTAIEIGEADKRYNLETLHNFVAIYDEKLGYNVNLNGTMDLIPRTGVDIITSNKLLTGYVNYFNLNIRNSIKELTRSDLLNNTDTMWIRPEFASVNDVITPIENLLFYGIYLDKSKIQVIDPEIEISELDVINAKTNNNGIITIDDPVDLLNPNQILKLYYPITIDVSKITIQRITPTIRLSIAQLQSKTHFPVSEMTNGLFDATNNIDLVNPLKLQPLTVNTIVRPTDIQLNKLIITDSASRHNIDGITNYENTLTLPLDDKEVIIRDTNTLTVNAATDNLIGFTKVTIKPQLLLEPLQEFHVPTYNDLQNNHYKFKKNTNQVNPQLIGFTEIDEDINLSGLTKTKTITVNEGSNTTLIASNDRCIGYEEITIKVRGDEDPDLAPNVVYPIPITAFGIYHIKPIYCVPPSTRCSSITFTYADLTAAIVAGGVMGLLPNMIPATATITENGEYLFKPDEYPIPQPTQNIAYSSFTVNVNVPIPTFTTQTKSITTNGTYTPDTGYDGFSEVTVNVPNQPLNTQTKTITTNGTYTPDTGYNGFSEVTVQVPNSTIGKLITANGYYIPESPYIGFESVNVQVPIPTFTTESKTITTNGTYTPSEGYDGFSDVVVNVNNRTQTKTITSNGTYTPTYSYIGFSRVTVNVPIPTFTTESKTITANGTYTPSEGYDGFSDVTVNVPTSSFNTQTKTITTNGTYTPDTGYNGFSQVTVNVPNSTIGKLITANGYYIPESPYIGYSSVNVQIPIPTFTTQSKTITSNGTYTPDTGYDGFSQVTVNIPKPTLGKLTIGSSTINLLTTNWKYNNISNTTLTTITDNTLIKITQSNNNLIFELFKPTVYNNATFPIEYGCYYKLFPINIDTNTNIKFSSTNSSNSLLFQTNSFYNTNNSNAYLYSKTTFYNNFYEFPILTYTPDM